MWVLGNNIGECGLVELLDKIDVDVRKTVHNYSHRLCKTFPIENLDKIIYLVKGEDSGRKAWYYIEVNARCNKKFLSGSNGSNINLDDYGKVIYSAYGDHPPQDIVDKVNNDYPIV